jgi:hypothetical protein
MACTISKADQILYLPDTDELAKATRKFKSDLDSLRSPDTTVPDFIAIYTLGCLVSIATQAALLAINNFDSKILKLAPEEMAKNAPTEIDPHEAPPTQRSPKMIMLETVQRLEEEKEKAN